MIPAFGNLAVEKGDSAYGLKPSRTALPKMSVRQPVVGSGPNVKRRILISISYERASSQILPLFWVFLLPNSRAPIDFWYWLSVGRSLAFLAGSSVKADLFV